MERTATSTVHRGTAGANTAALEERITGTARDMVIRVAVGCRDPSWFGLAEDIGQEPNYMATAPDYMATAVGTTSIRVGCIESSRVEGSMAAVCSISWVAMGTGSGPRQVKVLAQAHSIVEVLEASSVLWLNWRTREPSSESSWPHPILLI
jgi:hypothetical protein